ncbi:C-type mannose receptor 2-like [Syngnathus typhle]|uniref:C-type mannose receptor 2-like n=1 Tax=Syngnathus typhle TaxID=161592 RepID=UPI002A6AA223|nr:C-type mannose receptor 2-like [Syngnathus typhle]
MIPNGWLGAWHHCVWVGGNLLSITSSAEEDFVKRTMGEDTPFWLGLSNQKCGKVWCRFEDGSQNLTWSDNQMTTYTNWASNQVESGDVASCAYVNQGGSGEPGKWRSGSCRSSLAYMCKRPLSCPKGQTCSPKRGPAVVKTSDCQDNTFHYGDYCYRYEKTEKNFDNAEKFCRSRQGHLASVHSKEEAQFVHDHSQASQSVFVGLKKEDDDHNWSDGTTYDYDNWKDDAKGDCAFPNSVGELSASSCATERPFVCKRAQHGGLPQLPSLVGQPRWTDTCGWWLNDPTNNFCYLMIRQPTKTWQQAQDNCQRLHGNLISITNYEEQRFVHGYAMSLPSLWLGADVSTTEDDAQWSDGSPFTYIHSSADDAEGGKCLSLITDSGDWKHNTCDEKRSYVCKKTKKGVAEPSLSSDTSRCAPGWLEHGTNCYKKEMEPNGWLGAWHHCVWQGGDLLSVTTSAEEDFVKDTMGKDTRFWLGLSNQKCDEFWCRFEGGSQNLTWSDGETTTHRNWASNQLESANVASCAYVNQGGRGEPGMWRSGSCDSSLAYMCKRPLSCPKGQTCSPKSGLAVVKTSTCANGNLLYGDHCYFYSKLYKDWEDAEKFCVAQSGHLASVHSWQEAQFVFDHSQSVWYSWLGLKKKSNNYEYSDGTAFDYADWQNDTTGDCAFPNPVGKIDGSPCTTKRPFVCKTAKRGGPQQLPPLVSQQGWTDKCGWWLDDPTNDFCYLMIRQPTKTWQDAQDNCQRLHGNLLSITNYDEQRFVHGYVRFLPSLWLGANVSTTEDDAQWTDGSPFTYIHSSAGDAEGGKCLSLFTDRGDWKHDTCDKKRSYVCKKMKKGVAEPSLSSDASRCAPGWLDHGTNCYKKEMEPNGWLGAWHHCVWQGGDLLSITTSAEEDFVKDTMGKDTRFWLGLSNQKCDEFWCRFEGGSQKLTWSDGQTTTHRNWGSNQLESANVASCAYVNQGGRGEPGMWRSGSCDSSLAYMCKRPLSCPKGQTCSPKSGLAVMKTSTCANGNLLYGDHCYFYSKLYKDWEDAEKFCVAQSGHLASVHSRQEAQFVFDHSQSVWYSWLGLKKKSNNYEYSDGTAFDYAEWQNDTTGDCAFPNSVGQIGGSPCTTKRPFVCKTAKRGGPRQLPPLVNQQGWTDKCGWWPDDPTNDFCYLVIPQPSKTWQEAQADCKGRQGNLLSIADSLEQRFVRGIARLLGMNDDASLWLGADASIKRDGDMWTDGSPFSYLHSSAGVAEGGKCLSLLTGSDDWKRDKCDEKRGYVCKKRGKTDQLPPHDGYKEKLLCQDDWKSLGCPDERVIRIRSAFHGRRRSDVCPSGGGSRDDCRVEGALRHFRGLCDNYQICPIYPTYLTDTDSCPGVSKYLHVVYSCEKKVCLDSLGIADGRIPDSSFSASSSAINAEPHKARQGGSGCWSPSETFGSWIQVNLGQNFKVTGIETQSCTYKLQSSNRFAMLFSTDGVTWHRHPVQPTLGTYIATRPVFAQYVRLLPMFLGLRFDVLGCTSDDTPRNILCNNTATDLSLDGSMTVRCPLGCGQADYTVYGTRIYEQDSNICAAAIHSGIIEIGGDVTLLKSQPQKAYKGSTCNGITSTVYVGKLATSPSFTFADMEPRCSGPDWEEFGDFCYKHFDTKKSWYGARHSCWGLDANLVSIRSEAERDWLQDLMKLAPGDTWTGLNDLVNRGRFVWSDRQKVPSFTNWAPPGKPTSVMENCVATLSQSGKWKKMSCMKLNGYVCKMPTARYALDIKGANGSCE